MKKLIALLSISAFIGGCANEPTQLEKCVDINSKKIIAEMKKNYEEFPESVLYSRVESNKDFDEEHAKKQYPLVLKQMPLIKSRLDEGLISLEEYENCCAFGSYDEYADSIKIESGDLNDLFETKKFSLKSLSNLERNIDLNQYEINFKYLQLNSIDWIDKYIDYQLNRSQIKDMLMTSLESEATEFCNSQGIY